MPEESSGAGVTSSLPAIGYNYIAHTHTRTHARTRTNWW